MRTRLRWKENQIGIGWNEIQIKGESDWKRIGWRLLTEQANWTPELKNGTRTESQISRMFAARLSAFFICCDLFD